MFSLVTLKALLTDGRVRANSKDIWQEFYIQKVSTVHCSILNECLSVSTKWSRVRDFQKAVIKPHASVLCHSFKLLTDI